MQLLKKMWTLDQQQRVTKSCYSKSKGVAVKADSGEENIVNSVHGEKGANWVNGLEGLSDKEKESFASRNGDAYIEFGEAT